MERKGGKKGPICTKVWPVTTWSDFFCINIFPLVVKGWFYDCNKTADCSITAYFISMFMRKTKQIGKFFFQCQSKNNASEVTDQ